MESTKVLHWGLDPVCGVLGDVLLRLLEGAATAATQRRNSEVRWSLR